MENVEEVFKIIQTWVGEEEEPYTVEVDKTTMMKMPWVVDDPHPLWRDEKYARQTCWGGLIASPYVLDWLRHRPTYDSRFVPKEQPPLPGKPGNVVGGEEVEYFLPIRVGDKITMRHKITDVKRRKSGSLNKDIIILSHQITFTNQFGQVVMTHKMTSIKV